MRAKHLSAAMLIFLLWTCAGDGTTPTSPTVPEGPVATTVLIDPASARLTEGDTTRFSATVLDETGVPMPSQTVTWAVSSPDVAYIDGQGRLTAILAGSTSVQARSGGATGSASLSVDPYPPPGLLPTGDSMTGYLAPGTADTILLDLTDESVVQFRGTATMPIHFHVGNVYGGESFLDVSPGGTWYSAVFGGRWGPITVNAPPTTAVGTWYTLVADSIHYAPETANREVACGDTVRGEAIVNGDRDVFRIHCDGTMEILVRLDPAWATRSLHVVKTTYGFPDWGGILTESDTTWHSMGQATFSADGDLLEFRASQPWGREWTGPYEFVVLPAGG